MIELTFSQKIFQRHLHQHDQILLRATGLFQKLPARAVQHVVGRVGHRPKTATLDQDCLFVKYLRRLHRFPIGREHDRIGQTLADELQAHQPIVDLRIKWSGELDHVDLDAVGSDVLLQR